MSRPILLELAVEWAEFPLLSAVGEERLFCSCDGKERHSPHVVLLVREASRALADHHSIYFLNSIVKSYAGLGFCGNPSCTQMSKTVMTANCLGLKYQDAVPQLAEAAPGLPGCSLPCAPHLPAAHAVPQSHPRGSPA